MVSQGKACTIITRLHVFKSNTVEVIDRQTSAIDLIHRKIKLLRLLYEALRTHITTSATTLQKIDALQLSQLGEASTPLLSTKRTAKAWATSVQVDNGHSASHQKARASCTKKIRPTIRKLTAVAAVISLRCADETEAWSCLTISTRRHSQKSRQPIATSSSQS